MVRNLTILAFVLFAPMALAQLPHGKLDWIYPPGGQAGTQVDASIGGGDVDIADSIVFSHPGITAVQKRTMANEFEAARPIANQFRLDIAPSVPPGIYDARAVGRFGESTPRAFRVGAQVERNEPGDNTTIGKAAELPINEIVNGRISANSSDFYRIRLAKDQRVLIQVDAYAIDSKLDATLAVLDADGRQLRKNRDYRGRDPFIDFIAPADGEYMLQVYDFTYQGGNNHYYRLTASTDPVIEFVFPPSIEPGKTETVTLYGWNLPNSSTESWEIQGRPLESVTMSVTSPVPDALRQTDRPFVVGPDAVEVGGFYKRYEGIPFFIANAHGPVILEENNADSKHIQKLTVPCEVAGQFYPARDDDRYEFTAKAGDVFWVELFSQRQGCMTDPYLLVQRVERKEDGSESLSDVAEVDDGPKRPGGYAYESRSGDPVYRLSVPADGTYRLMVRDLIGQSRARPQNTYRLAIRHARPDYHLLVTPTSPFNPDGTQPMRWSHVLRRGGSIALPVSVLRVDGFNGPIDVSMAGLPEGISAPMVTVGPGRNSGVLVVSASETASSWSGPIDVIGTAMHKGRPVIRKADFATLAWDAPSKNAKRTPRLARGTILRVSDEMAPLHVAMSGKKRIVTSRGGKLTIPFTLKRRGEIKDKVSLGGNQLPGGVKAEVKLEDKKDNGVLNLTVEPGAKPGSCSFCLTGKTKISYRRLPDRVAVAESEKKTVEAKVAELAAAQTAAAAALTAAENELKSQNDLLAAANESFATLSQTTTTSAEKLATAKKAIEDATKPVADKSSARDAAAAASTAAQQKHAAAQEALKRITDRVNQLNENSKPGDRNIYVASNPVTLQIVQDPVNLQHPSQITVVQGAEHKLKIGIKRLYGFADGVRIEPSIDEATKISAQPIDVAKENGSGEIVIQSAADSPVGRHKLDLKAKLKFNGFDLEVNRSVQVVVTAPPAPEAKPEANTEAKPVTPEAKTDAS